ncbi:YcbK family protein [Massilia violaceinigra]|uniref:Murein endopeptidase K n=2 Tax=Massilia violaceinigra TaxID=2045208 RepID=A0ABY4AFR8_9BURK|nr:YcbK family protein [Massilia violaceinigra]
MISVPLIGCGSASAAPSAADKPKRPVQAGKAGKSAPAAPVARAPAPGAAASTELAPPPDIFDAQALDLDFWLKPRVLTMIRPQSGEKTKVLYWKDGQVIDAAYQELCHLMRDVNGKETAPIDPKLFETLWGTQAFLERYGIEQPLEILSGYRTSRSNDKLREAGVPAARQSLHIEGKAADIRIANLNSEVLGGLVRSFRQGGVGYYYRSGPRGGWIHADTGLKRTWKG